MKKRAKKTKAKTPAKRARIRRTKKKDARPLSLRGLRYVIAARRTAKSPRMIYDGKRFSETGPFRKFDTVDSARTSAAGLLRKYPVLRKYRVTIETEPRPR